MTSDSMNRFEQAHLDRWWDATRRYLSAEMEGPPETTRRLPDRTGFPLALKLGGAIRTGLAWAATASLSLASPADPAQATRGAEAHCEPDLSDHWALYLHLADRRAPESPSRPDFSGNWAPNVEASDDPREKTKETMPATKEGRVGGRGGGGGHDRF